MLILILNPILILKTNMANFNLNHKGNFNLGLDLGHNPKNLDPHNILAHYHILRKCVNNINDNNRSNQFTLNKIFLRRRPWQNTHP